ncbi:hypothetical protein, partial [Enterococcus gallinarum]|uniref:hypothetical protein n=1 Tax=Enterococcus gallinarum TaxID=1353 RepID=UPI00214BA7BE
LNFFEVLGFLLSVSAISSFETVAISDLSKVTGAAGSIGSVFTLGLKSIYISYYLYILLFVYKYFDRLH